MNKTTTSANPRVHCRGARGKGCKSWNIGRQGCKLARVSTNTEHLCLQEPVHTVFGFCFFFFPCLCDKYTLSKSHLGTRRKWVILVYTSRYQPLTEGSCVRRCVKVEAHWLAPSDLRSVTFVVELRTTTCSWVACLQCPTSITNNQDNSPLMCLQANLIQAIPQPRFLPR